MIFFVAANYRGANVSCILPGWPGQVRFNPPGRYRMYEGAICIVLAAGFSKVEKDGDSCRTPIFWGHLIHDFLVGGFKHGFYFPSYMGMSSFPLTDSIIFQAVFVVNLCEMMTSWRKWLNFSEHFFFSIMMFPTWQFF